MTATASSERTAGPVGRWLAASYADLTDGQRWTMALVGGLVVVFVAGGLRQPPASTADILSAVAPAPTVGLVPGSPPEPISAQPTLPDPAAVLAPVVAPSPPPRHATTSTTTTSTTTTTPTTTATEPPPAVTLPTLPGGA